MRTPFPSSVESPAFTSMSSTSTPALPPASAWENTVMGLVISAATIRFGADGLAAADASSGVR